MNRDLFLSILAMDSYNRGYGAGVNGDAAAAPRTAIAYSAIEEGDDKRTACCGPVWLDEMVRYSVGRILDLFVVLVDIPSRWGEA